MTTIASTHVRMAIAGLFATLVVILAACGGSSTATPASYGGRVIDASSGTHVPSGRVTVDQENGTSLTARINPDGTFRLPGEVTVGELIIDAPGYQRYRQSINIRQTAWPEVFRISRAAETSLLGYAVDAKTSAPVTRGEVAWVVPGQDALTGRIESDGSFRIEVPISGEVATGDVVIFATGYEQLERRVQLSRGQAPLEFRVAALTPTPLPTSRPTAERRPTIELLGFYTGQARSVPSAQLTPAGGRIADCNPQALNAAVRVQNVPRGVQLTASWYIADQEAPIATTTAEAATFTGSQVPTTGFGSYGYRISFQDATVAAGTVEIRCP